MVFEPALLAFATSINNLRSFYCLNLLILFRNIALLDLILSFMLILMQFKFATAFSLLLIFLSFQNFTLKFLYFHCLFIIPKPLIYNAIVSSHESLLAI